MGSGAANQKSFFEGQVGFDGVDTVIRVQGIALLRRTVSERDVLPVEGQVGWHREG